MSLRPSKPARLTPIALQLHIMGKHMARKDQDLATRVAHKFKKKKRVAVAKAFKTLNSARDRAGEEPITRGAVGRYLAGSTHKRFMVETHGRKATLTDSDVKKLLSVRRRLIKKSNNQHCIVYKDVIDEAGQGSGRGQGAAGPGGGRGGGSGPTRSQKILFFIGKHNLYNNQYNEDLEKD